MIIKPIPDKIKHYVWNFLQNHNVGNRHTANGNKEEQYVGLLGEMMISDMFNGEYKLKSGFDGGFDLIINGRKVDVKTMGRNVDVKMNYVNNFIGFQSHFNCDIYIFCSINKRKSELTMCGWVTKQELFDRADYYPKGTIRTRDDGSSFEFKADTYEIKNIDLNAAETL